MLLMLVFHMFSLFSVRRSNFLLTQIVVAPQAIYFQDSQTSLETQEIGNIKTLAGALLLLCIPTSGSCANSNLNTATKR